MMKDLRLLHLRGALGAVRTEMWDGREHLVVPVVALQEAVIHAVNAKNAEYVPTSSLAASVGRWNGHPLVVGHPVRDGKQISAHSPEVLARHGFGFIRQAMMKGTRLGMEAMVDTQRLAALKQDQLLADLRAGKSIEVSVGAFVTTNDKTGTFGGRKYDGEWMTIEPDHLAFLPGGVGACSLAMGCGAHRAAEGTYLVTAEGLERFEALGDVPGHEFHGNQWALGGETGVAAKVFNGPEREAERKAAAKEAHQQLTKAGFVKQSSEKKHTPSQKMGRSTAYSGTFDKRETTYQHPDGRSARMIERWSRYGAHTVAVHHTRAVKGLSMNANATSLKERVLALFDTPEQAASEEAAELIAYHSMRDQFDAIGDQWDAASKLINDLISDEEKDPTLTPEQEQAEEEVEEARLDAIRMHCYSMISALHGVCNACSEQQLPGIATSDPRYMEQFKALIGKSISAKNMSTIQAAHDASHDMHGHTVALGAECNGMKLLAAKECPTCEGTGQVTKDGKQEDCATCDGTGAMKAAESASEDDAKLKAACRCEEDNVDKKERIAALLTNEHNPIKDIKVLEAASDDVIGIFEAQAKTNAKTAADLKAAQDAAAKAQAELKAAAERVPTEEEFLKTAPESIRTLVAEKKAQDAAQKAQLVASLKVAAKGVYSDEELDAKPTAELLKLAQVARVETPAADYSGRGIPVPRAAGGEDYTPPDPYEKDLKALRSVN